MLPQVLLSAPLFKGNSAHSEGPAGHLIFFGNCFQRENNYVVVIHQNYLVEFHQFDILALCHCALSVMSYMTCIEDMDLSAPAIRSLIADHVTYVEATTYFHFQVQVRLKSLRYLNRGFAVGPLLCIIVQKSQCA